MGTKNGKWDGRGNPPSYQAALEWMRSQGLSQAQATQYLPGSGMSRQRMGEMARRGARLAETEHRGLAIDASRVSIDSLGMPGDWWRQGRSPGKSGGGGGGGKSSGGGVTDANGDGRISDDLARAGGGEGDDLESLIAGGPGEAGNGRGSALWPYQASEDVLSGLKVANRSKLPQNGTPWSRIPQGQEIGARYFEADTLGPLRWSPEQRADLQRLMHQIGLYGDQKVRLGSWTAEDQAVFAEVLAESNVAGVMWVELLDAWKKHPPTEVLERIKGDQPQKPTIQLTNPMDIRQGAEQVSRELTGAVDRGFANASVGGYQSMESAAQSAVGADQAGGGGGSVTQAPSMGAFLEDKLRREQPLEVDGYQFLGQFQNFLAMMGAQ